ncbi:MAG: Y-family DNA polymerase [Cyanobium sp.]
MARATVLIDGNNFYASCEAVLDASVIGRPLVVLSNNDGCIVSRSAEARALGIPMGSPYFKVRAELERHGVIVRSSNYSLYADMSQRLMATLEGWVEELEIYSIDEAFGLLSRPRGTADEPGDLRRWGLELRQQVRRRLGLPVAVGIASTKVRAKVANRIAKRELACGGVFDLEATPEADAVLESVAIEDVWGIGRRLSRWCRLRGISHARALRDMPSGELRRHCGVVGVRLQQELRGVACLPLMAEVPARQETCVSRSFSNPIRTREELREAVATYLARAAEKLRRQRQLCGCITVFVRSSPFDGSSFYSNAATVGLTTASNDTGALLAAALPLVDLLFRPHKPLQKAGVLLQKLQSDGQLQAHLLTPLDPGDQQRREALMAVVDNLNRRYGRGTLQWAACGLAPRWAMRRSRLSGAATTRLDELPRVWA